MTFKELNIIEPIQRAVSEKGYTQTTPIQEKGIPVVISGQDMFGIAQTGTGKTATFTIPIIQAIAEEKEARRKEEARLEAEANRNRTMAPENEGEEGDRNGSRKGRNRRDNTRGGRADKRNLRALILTPTRELAIQIGESIRDYGKYTGLRHCVIFGGVKQGAQVESVRRGVDIMVATPGRLIDLMGQGIISLDTITHFVLDEADRMLDMGFIADIRRILPRLPQKRQTLLFSATMPSDIVSLSRTMLKDPVSIEVTPVFSAVETVDQCIYFVEKPDKKKLLINLLKEDLDRSVLIFSRTKHGADNISRILKRSGIQSDAIHGDKSQGQRQRALSDFKSGKVRVMVATDIAARGLDINELNLVINYDLPDVPETYVHRIGRTGRAGHSGTAFTFCSQDDHMMVKDIQKLTGKQLKMVLHQS